MAGVAYVPGASFGGGKVAPRPNHTPAKPVKTNAGGFLSRMQWGQTAAAKQKGASYGKYLAYVNTMRKRRGLLPGGGSVYDPLAPQPFAQYAAQTRNYVNSQINPFMQQINNQYNQQAQLGAAAINRYARSLAGSLATVAPRVNQYYGQQAATLGAINAGLAQTARAPLGNSQQQLANYLTAAGADPQFGVNAQHLGEGVVGNIAARGAINVGRHANERAAQSTFAAGLPAIATVSGLRSLRMLQSENARNRKDALDKLRAQVPGLIQQLYQSYYTNETNKAIGRIAGMNQATTANAAVLRATKPDPYLLVVSKDVSAGHKDGLARNRYGQILYTDNKGNTRTSPAKGFVAQTYTPPVKKTKSGSTPTSGPGSKAYDAQFAPDVKQSQSGGSGKNQGKYARNKYGQIIYVNSAGKRRTASAPGYKPMPYTTPPKSSTKASASARNKDVTVRQDAIQTAEADAKTWYNYGASVAPKGTPKTTGSRVRTSGAGSGYPGWTKLTPDQQNKLYRKAYLAIYAEFKSKLPGLTGKEYEQLTRAALRTGGFEYGKKK